MSSAALTCVELAGVAEIEPTVAGFRLGAAQSADSAFRPWTGVPASGGAIADHSTPTLFSAFQVLVLRQFLGPARHSIMRVATFRGLTL